MPKAKSFIPSRQADLHQWLGNFNAKFGTIALELQYATEEIAAVHEPILEIREAYEEMNTRRMEADAAAARYKTACENSMGIVSRFVQNLKSKPTYTPVIGEELGIITPAATITDLETSPELNLSLQSGNVLVKFVKNGMSGINLYSRRGENNTFTFLGFKQSSPYKDTRPNLFEGVPKKRDYSAVYVDKDEETGPSSPVFSILV